MHTRYKNIFNEKRYYELNRTRKTSGWLINFISSPATQKSYTGLGTL